MSGTSIDKMLAIAKQLYPTGRAFKMFEGSWMEALQTGLIVIEAQAYEDAVSIELSLIPDNSSFDLSDCADWERRLGLKSNSLASLADRRAAILTKMSFPGRNPARSNYLSIEARLQASGFGVWVHENIPEQVPSDLNSNLLTSTICGNGLRSGIRCESHLNHIIANSLENSHDIYFDQGQNFRAAFFIGGQTPGTYADVPAAREQSLRQMVLRIKPVKTIAYLFITYI